MFTISNIFYQIFALWTCSNVRNLHLKISFSIRHSIHHKRSSPRSLSNQLPTTIAGITLTGIAVPYPSLTALVTKILITFWAFYLLNLKSYIRHLVSTFRTLLRIGFLPVLAQLILDKIHLFLREPSNKST